MPPPEFSPLTPPSSTNSPQNELKEKDNSCIPSTPVRHTEKEGFIGRHTRTEKPSELFRYYLEDEGVLEAFTKSLATLKLVPEEERPEEPMKMVVQEFLRSDTKAMLSTVRKREIELSMERVAELEKEIAEQEKTIAELQEQCLP